jgi:hypothetical protein
MKYLWIIVICLLLATGCASSSDNSAAQTATTSALTPDLPSFMILNGTWEGTQSITSIGACYYDGPESVPVVMVWRVNIDGTIEIIESFPDHPEEINVADWSGYVDDDMNITLQRLQDDFTCEGVPQTVIGEYTPVVERQGDSLHLDMEADEAWCPAKECIFRVQYSVSMTP